MSVRPILNALILAAMVGAVYGVYTTGRYVGQTTERLVWTERHNAALQDQRREMAREITRQTEAHNAAVKKAQDHEAALDSYRDRARATEQRLRDEADARATAIRNAGAQALREYATGADRLLDRCRNEFGRMAERAAAASSAAHQLYAQCQ